nr:BACON domain-containing protein [Dysgonomonas sp. GY75]
MPADEATVNTIDVLCFQTDPANPTDVDKGTFLYRATVGHTAGDNSFTVILSELDVNQTFVVLANCRTQVETLLGSISTGTPKASVISSLVLEQSSAFDASVMTGIPMWGEITDQAVTSGYSPGPLNVTLTRMLARINITNSDTDGDFTLSEAFLYNPRQKGSVIPDNWTGSDVTTVTTVTGAQMAQGTVFGPFAAAAEQITDKIYTFEADNITQAGVSLLDATCLVVGGLYNGTMSYYRIDLKDYTTGVFYDVKRNYSYNVTINDIDTEGPDNPDAAFKGNSVFNATVQQWNDRGGSVITNPNFHLRVLPGSFAFTDVLGSATFSVFSDYPGGWTVTKIVDGAGADASSWLSTDVRSGATNATTNVSVSVTDNSGAARTGFIHIQAGNLTYKVTVNQDAYQVKWAGSNIYWDGTSSSLTFDDVSTSGSSLNEQYQGVYFKWGSLWGISPQGNWSDNSTIVYVPDNVGGYTSGIASSWLSVPYWDPGNISGNRDQKYLTETVHTPANIVNGQGDICKYLTELNGGTLYGKKWRMPTSNEFETASDYSSSGTYSDTPSTSADGTQLYTMGKRKTDDIGTPFFPASGYRSSSAGLLGYVGMQGFYWSSSPSGNSTSSYLLSFNSSTIIPGNITPYTYGLSVRCLAY